jgi:hypothetical protein
MAMGVDTPGNITSATTNELMVKEGEIGSFLYEYAGDSSKISTWSRIKIAIGKFLDRYKKGINKEISLTQSFNIDEFYNSAYEIIDVKNSNRNRQFQ